MNDATILRVIEGLKSAFSGSKVAQDGARTLVRLPSVPFPEGCEPSATEGLVVLAPGAAPEFYVRVIPKRPDGGTPRSTSTTLIAGESWGTFSFSLQWDPARHSAEQFVLGRLKRFALNE